MPKEGRSGDPTIGGRMDEDELLAIATAEGFGEDEEPSDEKEPARPS